MLAADDLLWAIFFFLGGALMAALGSKELLSDHHLIGLAPITLSIFVNWLAWMCVRDYKRARRRPPAALQPTANDFRPAGVTVQVGGYYTRDPKTGKAFMAHHEEQIERRDKRDSSRLKKVEKEMLDTGVRWVVANQFCVACLRCGKKQEWPAFEYPETRKRIRKFSDIHGLCRRDRSDREAMIGD